MQIIYTVRGEWRKSWIPISRMKADFEKEKEKWYEDVVFSEDAPDISNYKEYYESIDAANAEVLYKQVVEQTLTDEQMDDYVKTYSSMKRKRRQLFLIQ